MSRRRAQVQTPLPCGASAHQSSASTPLESSTMPAMRFRPLRSIGRRSSNFVDWRRPQSPRKPKIICAMRPLPWPAMTACCSAGRSLSALSLTTSGRSIVKEPICGQQRRSRRTSTLSRTQSSVTDACSRCWRWQTSRTLRSTVSIRSSSSMATAGGERMPSVAASDEELLETIRFLGQNTEPSRPFDDAHPTMTLALGDRFRLHAIAFGLSYRPSVVIRQHTLTDVSLADLAATGLMPYEVAQFLDAAILARKSMVISGDQGAGKTTLLRALINSIPLNERFGTLETDYELMTHLQPGRENILALQARVGHGETSGESRVGDFTISDLVPEALRQNLSRLVVGEVRGGEAAAMFEAMQAGAGAGELCTTPTRSRSYPDAERYPVPAR